MDIFCRLAALIVITFLSSSAAPLHHTPPSGAVFRDCRNCPQMVVIPAGKFRMGAAVDEVGTSPLEQPPHEVTVRSFAAGRFAVTRGEWAEFARATHWRTEAGCAYTGRPGPFMDPKGSWASLGFRQTDRHPVVCIAWPDARAYADWLSRRTGKHYRLLSEAEWEYAARAGTASAYPWGNRADRAHLNYGREKGYGEGLAKGRDRWVHTSPVGSFPPNRFGLHDMHGNVLQWVEDCLALTYDGTRSDGSAYRANVPIKAGGEFADLNGTMSCDFRMLRGGDWADPPEMTRSAFRNLGPPPPLKLDNFRSGGVGFRVARDLPQSRTR